MDNPYVQCIEDISAWRLMNYREKNLMDIGTDGCATVLRDKGGVNKKLRNMQCGQIKRQP